MGVSLRTGVWLAVCITALAWTGTAAAETYEVKTDADTVTETPAGHSLRSAIIAANANPGRDTIVLPEGLYSLEIGGAGEDAAQTGDLDITDDVTIDGAGRMSTTVSGSALDRVFHVVLPLDQLVLPQVTLEGLRVISGNVVPADTFDGGGGVKNDGLLTLTDVDVQSNVVDGSGHSAAGGGVLTSGSLTMTDVLISNNTSENSEGTALGGGLAVFANGVIDVEIDETVITQNFARAQLCGFGAGGGIYLSNATDTTITDSQIGDIEVGNEAHSSCVDQDIDHDEGEGGGIYNNTSGGDDTPATLVLIGTTVQNNEASRGGGIYNDGPLVISESSEVSSNVAFGANGVEVAGGGIFNEFGRRGGSNDELPVQIADSSVSQNAARGVGPDSDAEGGGIANDNGGIEIERSELAGNLATAENGDADGGGIFSSTFGCGECNETSGFVRLAETVIMQNTALDRGGGLWLDGDEGDLGRYEQGLIEDSEISGNTAARGAGLFVRGTADTLLFDTTVSENEAGLAGGGLYLDATYASITRSTVSGNSVPAEDALNQGGGIFARGGEFDEDFAGELEIDNSTVHGNAANLGGGIALVPGDPEDAGAAAPAAELRETTISDNEALVGEAIYNQGRPTVFGSIVSGPGALCDGDPLTSEGYNLDESEGTCGFDRDTDLIGVDPMLGPLADNGGPTATRLPQEGSPVIDHVPDCGGTDQRGVSRPQGEACDIGAVEVEQDGGGGGPENFIVDDDRVQCPSAAFTTIQAAVDASPDGTTIQVCAGLYTQEVAVHNEVTLQGPGADPTADCSTWGPADPTTDAIVDSDGIGLSLQVDDITVDGLVVRGNTTGIETSAEFSGFQILDNVIVGNTFGIELDSGGETASLVGRNCFTGNTRAGLHGDHLSNASVDDNAFVVDAESPSEVWGVFLGRIDCCGDPGVVDDVTVTDNVATGSTGNKRFVELSHTTDVDVLGNIASEFSSVVIFLANGNERTVVGGNTFSDSAGGIWASEIPGLGTGNREITISENSISGMDVYGLRAETAASLVDSTISANTITGSGENGIRFPAGSSGGNLVSANTVSGSGEHDCRDDTTGSGTAGTANTWHDNTGSTSLPAGLCGSGAVSVSDASANEGDTATFTVTLDRASGAETTVDYATASGTATEGTDFTSTEGTVTFAPGELSKTVGVPTTEDAEDESDETFTLDLSAPTNATISDGQGTGTIADDDEAAPTPAISISDASVTEGNAGTTEMTFTLTRTPAIGESQVSFATANGSATAGSDYNATSGTVIFGAGEGEKTVAVEVIGDLAVESDETLFVNLTSPVNATIADSQGQGTITNDDVAVVPAELALTKTDSPDPVTVGRDLTYSVTVTNSGLGAAQNVVVTDTLPAGVFFTFASSSQGTCTFLAPQVICTVGTVGSSAVVVITIVVQPITPGTLTNSATVTTTTPEGNAGNNTAQTTTTVNAAPPPPSAPQAKLDVIKTDEKDPVNVGQNIRYLITVDNDGAGDAHNVRLDDSLTDGVQFVSATPSQGTCTGSGGNVTCQLGTIPSGASASVDLVVKALRSGTVTNTARATTTSPADEELNSDFEQTTIDPEAGDLAIEKDVFTPLQRAAVGEQRTEKDRAGAAAVGRDFTYVLTAANDGPSPVTNVVVEDQLPKGLTAKSVQTSKGTCTTSPKSTYIECALGELAEGETASITIVVRPTKAGLYANVARIEGGAPDPVLVNNRARVETFVVAELPKVPIYRPACNFNGTDGPNQFRGGPKNEVFCGYDGRDDFDAGRGNDVIFAGFGNDLIRVDRGLDYHDGEEGDDLLRTADGDVDVVIGGVGVDRAIVDRLDFVVGVEFICIQTARRNCT